MSTDKKLKNLKLSDTFRTDLITSLAVMAITQEFLRLLKEENLTEVTTMGEIVLRNAVKREAGYLYYVDKDGNVCRAKMKHEGRSKSKKTK